MTVCTNIGESIEREWENEKKIVLKIQMPTREKNALKQYTRIREAHFSSIHMGLGLLGVGGGVLCFQLMCVVERNAIIFYNWIETRMIDI